jgi:hypothetical protein
MTDLVMPSVNKELEVVLPKAKMIAGIGQHVDTVLVAAMDKRALDVVIAITTILQQVVVFGLTTVVLGLSSG